MVPNGWLGERGCPKGSLKDSKNTGLRPQPACAPRAGAGRNPSPPLRVDPNSSTSAPTNYFGLPAPAALACLTLEHVIKACPRRKIQNGEIRRTWWTHENNYYCP